MLEHEIFGGLQPCAGFGGGYCRSPDSNCCLRTSRQPSAPRAHALLPLNLLPAQDMGIKEVGGHIQEAAMLWELLQDGSG